MPAPELTEALKPFAKKLGAAVSSALTEASGSAWQLTVEDEPSRELPTAAESVCFRFSFEGSLEGESFLLIKQEELSTIVLKEAPAGVGTKESQASGLLTVLRQGAAGLEKLLSEHGAVLVSIELFEEPQSPDGSIVELSAHSEEIGTRLPLFLRFGKKLETMLLASSAKPFVFPSAAESPNANLDLVLDVELNVTLRFGQRQLALREVLDLTSGSVVELDRQVDEPVELVLDGRVVARGEAVIIDGNYGMRITQVVQPIEV